MSTRFDLSKTKTIRQTITIAGVSFPTPSGVGNAILKNEGLSNIRFTMNNTNQNFFTLMPNETVQIEITSEVEFKAAAENTDSTLAVIMW